MSDRLPTAEEAFGPLPTADEAFPLPKPLPNIPDPVDLVSRLLPRPSKPVLDTFAKGFAFGWGDRPLGISGDDAQWFRDVGLWNDFEKGQRSLIKSFNEVLLGGTAVGLDLLFQRLPVSTYYGAAEVAIDAGLPRDVAGLPEAFPGGRFTGLPARPRPTNPMPDIDLALELGVIEGGPAVTPARRAFSPEGIERPTERVVGETTTATPETIAPEAIAPEARAALPEAGPPDVHALARQLSPDVFREYDALAQRKEVFWRWLDELAETRRQDPRAVALQTRIDEALGKVGGVESRLTNAARNRIEAWRSELETLTQGDTPDMARVRRDMQQTDFKMRDLAEQVSEAYREARRLTPEEVVPVLTSEPVRPTVPEPPPITIAEIVSPEIQTLAQRRPSIRADTERRLIDAGRPRDEARASAALVAAHYEARAARFNGALGTALDLYEAEAPRIRTGTGPQRGRLTLNDARSTITLFEKADASTFVHETAHVWLNEMLRDAQHRAAPIGLRDDLTTVRNWLGAEVDKPLTRAQHEKFARGFERYLMEGQAPSARLAGVFEKFKEWLTKIYQTVSGLRSKINDDIRGVYDRLLAAPRRDPVITPERQGAQDFAAFHETTVRETTPAEARARAVDIRAERDRVAELLRREIQDARRNARRGQERTAIPEPSQPGRGDVARGESVAAADAALNEGRSPAAGKSTPPRDATATFEPVDRALVDKAGNIRIENLNVPEDVGTVIREVAAEKGDFGSARRGVLTDPEVLALADELGMTPRKLDRRKIGEAFNAEQIVAARQLLREAATATRDAMARAATGTTKDVLAYGQARSRLLMIQEQVAGITAEAGRALRAFRDMAGIEDLNALNALFQDANIRVKGTFLDNIAGVTELDKLRREAEFGVKLVDTHKVNKYVREQASPTSGKMFTEGFINFLLSGPHTHLVNALGNTSVIFSSIVETAAAATVSKIRGSDAVTFGEVADRFYGIGQGSKDGIRAAGVVLWDETAIGRTPEFRRPGNLLAPERPNPHTVEQAFLRAIPSKTINVGGIDWNVGGAQVRLPGRALSSADEFFKGIAFRQEMLVLARRRARAEGLEGDAMTRRIADILREMPEDLVEQANQFAEYQTFTNRLGPIGRTVQQYANSNVPAKVILPFIRTPTNLYKYSVVERTPFGLLSTRIRDTLSGRHGEAARDTQIARLALGSMVATGVAMWTLDGAITGGGPLDDAQKAVMRLSGWMPHAFKLGNAYYAYERLDPWSTVIGLSADLTEIAHHALISEDEDLREQISAMLVTAIAENIFNKLSLRGITELSNAITEPERYADRYVQNLIASGIPALVAQAARIDDGTLREARTLMDTLKSRLPGQRETLMPRRDIWGEPIPQEMLGPIMMSRQNNDPVNQTLLRLGMGVARPDRKIQGVELTPEQYDDYARIAGRFAKMRLDQMVRQPAFQRLPNGVQVSTIKGIIDQSRAMARQQVMMQSMGSENDLVRKGLELKLEELR